MVMPHSKNIIYLEVNLTKGMQVKLKHIIEEIKEDLVNGRIYYVP